MEAAATVAHLQLAERAAYLWQLVEMLSGPPDFMAADHQVKGLPATYKPLVL